MINCYLKKDNELTVVQGIDFIKDNQNKNSVIWIDMFLPTRSEIKSVEELFDMKFPTRQESEEIELSSRYWEENNRIEINSYFLISSKDASSNETVSFILEKDFLISVRYKALESFSIFTKRLMANPKDYKNGYSIFSQIIDIRIDSDADIIENLSRDITDLRKDVFDDYANSDQGRLKKFSLLEDLNMNIRESLNDKQRILNALSKSQKFESEKSELQIMVKDIKSLIDHTDFNFKRLDYLQSVFIGLLKIEQNKTIKMFTVANIVFLPPTLIGSIYGMNFEIMPELQWEYGYAFAIGLMLIAAISPIIIAKKKGWM